MNAPLPHIRCAECFAPIRPRSITTRYCSVNCRNKDWQRRKREATRHEYETVPCVTCGKPFVKYTIRRRFCSEPCHRENKKRAARGTVDQKRKCDSQPHHCPRCPAILPRHEFVRVIVAGRGRLWCPECAAAPREGTVCQGPDETGCFGMSWRRVNAAGVAGDCAICGEPYAPEPNLVVADFLRTRGNLDRARDSAPGVIGISNGRNTFDPADVRADAEVDS